MAKICENHLVALVVNVQVKVELVDLARVSHLDRAGPPGVRLAQAPAGGGGGKNKYFWYSDSQIKKY